MTQNFNMTVDGEKIEAKAGETIMEACDRAGVYIPRLCDNEDLEPQGSCRVCTVIVNGRPVAACTYPAEDGAVIQHETEEITNYRRDLVRMLFQEGNHVCPTCEASGRCELQAMAYRLDINQPAKYPYLQPVREIDASHKDIMIDSNRCILCARCIRASREVDKKGIFGYVGRGIHKKIGVNADCLAESEADINDLAFVIGTCPVGCIIQKEKGFFAPVGERLYDSEPIGSEIEKRRKPKSGDPS